MSLSVCLLPHVSVCMSQSVCLRPSPSTCLCIFVSICLSQSVSLCVSLASLAWYLFAAASVACTWHHKPPLLVVAEWHHRSSYLCRCSLLLTSNTSTVVFLADSYTRRTTWCIESPSHSETGNQRNNSAAIVLYASCKLIVDTSYWKQSRFTVNCIMNVSEICYSVILAFN